MLKLVQKTGYPFEYLIARINYRASYLITNIEIFKKSPEMLNYFDMEAFQLTFIKEINFCYYQMEERERQIFKNLFLLFEINNLISSIRFSLYDRADLIEEIFRNSLLTGAVRDILIKGGPFIEKLRDLCMLMTTINREISNLPDVYQERGLRDFEETLYKLYCEGLVFDKENIEAVRYFLKSYIDVANINGIGKEIRWDSKRKTPFIEGGFLSREEIIQKLQRETSFTAVKYLRNLANEFKKRKTLSDYYFFIYYVLLLYLENVNLNILFYTLDFQAEDVEKSLI